LGVWGRLCRCVCVCVGGWGGGLAAIETTQLEWGCTSVTSHGVPVCAGVLVEVGGGCCGGGCVGGCVGVCGWVSGRSWVGGGLGWAAVSKSVLVYILVTHHHRDPLWCPLVVAEAQSGIASPAPEGQPVPGSGTQPLAPPPAPLHGAGAGFGSGAEGSGAGAGAGLGLSCASSLNACCCCCCCCCEVHCPSVCPFFLLLSPSEATVVGDSGTVVVGASSSGDFAGGHIPAVGPVSVRSPSPPTNLPNPPKPHPTRSPRCAATPSHCDLGVPCVDQ
jgi:hypothetical protein